LHFDFAAFNVGLSMSRNPLVSNVWQEYEGIVNCTTDKNM